jgi:hypothetical protein
MHQATCGKERTTTWAEYRSLVFGEVGRERIAHRLMHSGGLSLYEGGMHPLQRAGGALPSDGELISTFPCGRVEGG